MNHTLNDIVRYSLIGYPTIFRTRADVLHHLFEVNGCGYNWTNCGRLIEVGCAWKSWPKNADALALEERERGKQFALQYASEHFERQSTCDPEFAEEVRKRRLQQIEKQYSPVDWGEIEKAAVDERFLGTPYPLCKYAMCLTVPDSVQPDFLQGAIQVLDRIIDTFTRGELLHPDSPYHTRRFIKRDWTDAERSKQLEVAVQGRENIRQRFGV